MKYFTLQELTRSETAERLGINNTPDAAVVGHLEELTERLLDPLREAFGRPIIVTSGYRCPELNKAVGGSPTSAHLQGYAADLVPKNGNVQLFLEFTYWWLLREGKPYDQLIAETSSKGARWVHLGLYSPRHTQRYENKTLFKNEDN